MADESPASDAPLQPAVPILDGAPTARAWVAAIAAVLIAVTLLAWGLSVLP